MSEDYKYNYIVQNIVKKVLWGKQTLKSARKMLIYVIFVFIYLFIYLFI